jgi:uncharacterized protein (AIM24 family)
VVSSYTCRYCRQDSEDPAICTRCGAPIDVTARVSDSGWMEQPMLSDMSRLQSGQVRCQIAGTVVPVAEFGLPDDETVYFPWSALLWTDTRTRLEPVQADPRHIDLVGLLEGRGPGHLGVSLDHAGELVAVPLRSGQRIQAGTRHFLCATGTLKYRINQTLVHYSRYKGSEQELEYPMGRYNLAFTASRGPGLLLLHSSGNVFIRDLGDDETILVQPTSLLYWDERVDLTLHLEYPRYPGKRDPRHPSNYRCLWLRLRGPGRVAVQSMYEPVENEGVPNPFSFASIKRW